MNGVLRHVDSYTGHVMRASKLMEDIDLKGNIYKEEMLFVILLYTYREK